MKIPNNIQITIPLPDSIKDKLFGDKGPIPIDKTIEDNELKEANEELQKIKEHVELQEDICHDWKDII